MLLSRCWISFSNYPVKPQLGNGLGFCPGHTSIPNCCFCPRHMGTSIGKPAFPRTWAVHGPRGRTAIFHHGCLAQPLIFCPSHIFLTRRKLAFPVTWAVHRPRGRIVVFHHEHLDELLFFLPWTHLSCVGKPAFQGTWDIHGPHTKSPRFSLSARRKRLAMGRERATEAKTGPNRVTGGGNG
jgi:hypothetical protein